MNREEEKQLIRQAQQGNAEAFMTLARTYESKIFNLIYRLTKNREDTADLTQETFLNAFRAIREFRASSSFHTWLHRIAVNLSLNFLKRSERQKKYREYYINNSQESRERENDLVNNIDSPEDVSAAEQLKASLEKAFDELPIIYKAAFSLVVYEGMSHREAAEVLGCSEGTVSWRIHQARRMIKEKLQPYFGQRKET